MQEAADASRRAEATRAIVSQRAILVSLRDQLTKSTAEREAASREIATLGAVDYDPDEHHATEQALAQAVAAIARLNQIDQELANRPSYEAQHASALAAAATVAAEMAAVEQRRAELHFDPSELDRASAAERAAAVQAREADRSLSSARAQVQAAIRDRDATVLDHERVANLARRSEIRRREYDELERMYREFDRFDQYVAQLVTPQLADYTGELLAEVTDHKYDQVTFDDNYGVRLFDGPEDFPLEQFSGGERDVAALCARLALSRFIGAQAAHPPRFLVLDEVFGSLDSDRRSHVLGALLKLAGNDGPFRQLFIISHVDDVRQSSSLDEVWRVHEVDGASKVENVSRSGQVEEL
jgi:exonuclease SbcC